MSSGASAWTVARDSAATASSRWSPAGGRWGAPTWAPWSTRPSGKRSRIREDGSAAVDAEVLFEERCRNGSPLGPPRSSRWRVPGRHVRRQRDPLPTGGGGTDRRRDQSPEPDRGGSGPRACHRDGFDRGAGRWIHVAHGGLRCPRRRSHGERREGDHPPRAAATDDGRGPPRDPGGPPGRVEPSCQPPASWIGKATRRCSQAYKREPWISTFASDLVRTSGGPVSRGPEPLRRAAG